MPPPPRIYFPNSPWPHGHALKDFLWSARLIPNSGIWFDFHLHTVDYNSEHPPALDDDASTDGPGWDSSLVWNNFHSCTLSSTTWACEAQEGDDLGVLAATASLPLNLREPLDLTCDTDLSDPPDAPRPFGIYLLGHDTAADHHIHIRPNPNPDPHSAARTFHITWTGQIALVYSGEYEFKHRFQATIPAATFQGIRCPPDMDPRTAVEAAAPFLTHPAIFDPVLREGATWLRP